MGGTKPAGLAGQPEEEPETEILTQIDAAGAKVGTSASRPRLVTGSGR
jgi:hypothetical protein